MLLSLPAYITLCILYSIRLEVEGEARRAASRMSRRTSEPSQAIPPEQNHVAAAIVGTLEDPKYQDYDLKDQDILDAMEG